MGRQARKTFVHHPSKAATTTITCKVSYAMVRSEGCGLHRCAFALYCRSDQLRKVSDTLCGFAIQGLYLTYFMLVKGMLNAFACTTKPNGASVLTAEPSFSCIDVRREIAAFVVATVLISA